MGRGWKEIPKCQNIMSNRTRSTRGETMGRTEGRLGEGRRTRSRHEMSRVTGIVVRKNKLKPNKKGG